MPSLPYSLEALVFDRSRSISWDDNGQTVELVPDITISEEHSDDVLITKHPVDTGANINDHAIKQPSVVRCTYGWSDSSRLINSLLDLSILKGLESTSDIYDLLLQLQKNRTLLTVKTGKRTYENMILTGLRVSTTENTESALIADCTFEEIILANVETVTLAPEKQQDASRTASVNNGGQKNAISVGGSIRQ